MYDRSTKKNTSSSCKTSAAFTYCGTEERSSEGRPSLHTSPIIYWESAMSNEDFKPNDVLLGRGTTINRHPGNIRFRQLVSEKKAQYMSLQRNHDKDMLAREIGRAVVETGGRFLSKKVQHTPGNRVVWEAASEETVLMKVKQAMRDKYRTDRAMRSSSKLSLPELPTSGQQTRTGGQFSTRRPFLQAPIGSQRSRETLVPLQSPTLLLNTLRRDCPMPFSSFTPYLHPATLSPLSSMSHSIQHQYAQVTHEDRFQERIQQPINQCGEPDSRFLSLLIQQHRVQSEQRMEELRRLGHLSRASDRIANPVFSYGADVGLSIRNFDLESRIVNSRMARIPSSLLRADTGMVGQDDLVDIARLNPFHTSNVDSRSRCNRNTLSIASSQVESGDRTTLNRSTDQVKSTE